MAWVRVDDQFAEHPKVLKLGRDRLPAIGLWLQGLTYANRYLTDGFIPEGALPPGSRRLAGRLVDVGLWQRVPNGFEVHDYADYQQDRDKVLALRAERAEAGRKGGLASGSKRRSTDEANASAMGQTSASPGLEANANPGHHPSGTPSESTTTTPDPSAAPIVAAYKEAYGREPTGAARAWLGDMADRYGPSRTLDAFGAEHATDSDLTSLLGRMEQGLKEGNKRRSLQRLQVVEEAQG
jgi:hypothetical protein